MKRKAAKTRKTHMIIDNIRLAYVHLDEPRAAAEGAEPKYSVTLIIPKDHPQVAEIREAMQAAIAAKWGAKPPKGLRSPLRDGDATDDSGERMKGAEFRDAYFVTASNKKPVKVVAGKDRGPAAAEHKQAGNYASVMVGFFGYDAAGNRGVGAGLNGVWITRRGESLGGPNEAWRETEAEDFNVIAERATAAGQQSGDIF
jgi:hypothetical protein